MYWGIIALYVLSLLLIFIFSLGQLHLAWHYLRAQKKKLVAPQMPESDLPFVTVQLPLYNEKYVAERLLRCAIQLQYPKDKLEIQVLDDSTDETSALITQVLNEIDPDHQLFHHIQRTDRTGFKAGALAYGLSKAKGELMAVFDADFLPQPDFLQQTVPYFQNSQIGVVQTRWGHLNQDYSILTKLQAFALDAHFTVEQVGRSAAGSFINFNGTAGVWRKSTIEDAGSWSADTLTEDLDLSYRAQLKGWKFQYAENIVAPAELPVIMPAIKSQQYRWNKGGAETARKHIRTILKTKLSFWQKFHAFMHLFNSSVFVMILISALLSLPVLWIAGSHPQTHWVFLVSSVFLIGFFSIAYFYWVASIRSGIAHKPRYFFRYFPAFLVVSMGLSYHNAKAVLSGLLGRKSAFIRTPKFNIYHKKESWKQNQYLKNLKGDFWVEGLLALYFIGGIVLAFYLQLFTLLFFHILLAVGFSLVAFFSLKTRLH